MFRLIHEWKHAWLAPPLPLMSVNNSQLCSTHNHARLISLEHSTAAPTINVILVKTQPSTPSTWPLSPTIGLAYGRETWAYPRNE